MVCVEIMDDVRERERERERIRSGCVVVVF